MSKESVKDNCLNVIKLVSALQVMYDHTVAHLEIQTVPWFDKLFGVFQGVPIFLH